MTARADHLRLDQVPPPLREQAARAVEEGNIDLLLLSTGNEGALAFVVDNLALLRDRGLYERALLEAFIGTRTNNSHWPHAKLAALFGRCDRDRLRAAGAPLPGPGPFTLYRGVAGHGPRRRPCGFSWSDDSERARWFATRFALAQAAVLRVTVEEPAVLAYVNARNEHEFLVALPPNARPVRVWPATSTQEGAGHR
jgi:hypothetical protein